MGACMLEFGCDATTVYTRSVRSLSHTSSADRIGLPSMRIDVALNCTTPRSGEFSFISLSLSASTASLNWNWCRSELREAPSITVFVWALTVVRKSEQSKQAVHRCARFPIVEGNWLLSYYWCTIHFVTWFNTKHMPFFPHHFFIFILSHPSFLAVFFFHLPETKIVISTFQMCCS